MGWQETVAGTQSKWDNLCDLAARGEAALFRSQLLEGCTFCSTAQAEIDALGVPKVKMFACDFCRGFLDYGGCQDPVNRILAALDAGDWTTVRAEVDGVREFLRTLKPAS